MEQLWAQKTGAAPNHTHKDNPLELSPQRYTNSRNPQVKTA